MRFRNGSWELYAETFGAAGDPALVLLHGAGNSMMAWDAALCEAIAGRGRFVVRLDSRDAGQSARRSDPGPTSMDDMAGDVVALLDALALPAAVLAGVSHGGVLAQIVAVEHPDRVSGLVLISTTPGGEDLPGPDEGAFTGGPDEPDWADRAAVVRYLVEVERPYGGRRFDEELMTRIAERTVDHATDLAGQLRHPYEVEFARAPRHDAIRAPTVVVHGTADPMFPIEHGRALSAAIPGAALIEVDGFGHATLPRDEWPRLVELITRPPAPPSSAAGPAR
jgi:pimeloyl-ACP methyl ester carboxylesterase